jgi:hypothetical protein
MNTNENIRTNPQNDVIELGVASTETLGGAGPRNEELGFLTATGLSED